jgi:hypothetical protein
MVENGEMSRQFIFMNKLNIKKGQCRYVKIKHIWGNIKDDILGKMQ